MIPADLVAVVSGAAAALSAGIALVAAWFSRNAVRAAREQSVVARHAAQIEAVIHFTSRFHEVNGAGPRYEDPVWSYQLWGLLTTEYYFFEKEWIPDFMFELWMVELVSAYQDDTVRRSHLDYLQNVQNSYRPMCDFFKKVLELSDRHFGDDRERNNAVSTLVKGWPRSAT